MVMLRSAGTEDAARLLEIYGYYVVNTAITFEYDVPSREAFSARPGAVTTTANRGAAENTALLWAAAAFGVRVASWMKRS